MIRWISLYDLMENEEMHEIIKNDDISEFYRVMYDIGFDINHEIDFQLVDCRSMTNPGVITNGRYVGTE